MLLSLFYGVREKLKKQNIIVCNLKIEILKEVKRYAKIKELIKEIIRIKNSK